MAVTRDLWIVLRARDEASRIIRSFSHNLGGAAGLANQNMSDFEQTMQRVALRINQFAQISMLAGASLAGIGAAGLSFIHDVTKVAAEYDRQVRHTLTQVDDLTVGLDKIAQIGRNVAKEAKVPFEQLQETLFFIFSSIDVNAVEAEELLRKFAKEAVAGQSTIEAAAKSTIAIMNSLGLTVADVGRIQDTQFQIVRKGIINYEELASVIGRALPATARAGQSFETVGAMIAFLTRNGLSAAMAATSAARALESFAHPVTLKRLEGMGIKVRDIKGEFLPLINVMEQMNEKIQKLSAPERAKFLQELFVGAGGTIQARRFWDTAFKNFEQFEEMIGFMQNSAGVFENAYETMADSVAAKSELIRNKWMLIKESLGRALIPQLLKLIEIVEDVMDWFEQLPQSTKETIAQFILWGSIISILVGGLLIFVGTIAFVVSGIMLAGPALVYVMAAMIGLNAAIIVLIATIINLWHNSESFRETAKSLWETLKQLWAIVVDGAKEIAKAFDEKLKPSLEKIWKIIKEDIVPALQTFMQYWREEVLPKLEEAKRIIVDQLGKAFEIIAYILDTVVIPAIKRLVAWWKDHEEITKPLLAFAAQLVKWLLIIAVVLAAVPVVAIVAAFAVLVITIEVLIKVIKFLMDIVKLAFEVMIWPWMRIAEAIEFVINFIKSKAGELLEFFKDAGSWLRNVGENIINGLIDGIKNGASKLANVLKDITKNIPDWKGPRAVDIKLLTPVGQTIMKSLMLGIASQMPMLKQQLQGITTQVGQLSQPNVTMTNPYQYQQGQEQRVINQTININTNEINPRVHAMELGFELESRL